jgi:hypothetical protein
VNRPGTRAPAVAPSSHPTAFGAAYHAMVFAEGAVVGSDHRAGVTLGTFGSDYPGRVLRWLRHQALRVADGLDPYPSAAVPSSALCPDRAGHPQYPGGGPPVPGDVPTVLRGWAHDHGPRNDARRKLMSGEPFLLVSADHTGRYAFTAWPVGTFATPLAM